MTLEAAVQPPRRIVPEPACPRLKRIPSLDVLRGVALLGIAVVNATYVASPYAGSGIVDPRHVGSVDTAVRFLVLAIFETKFYLLFSFLFGYSFTIQIDGARRRGLAFVPMFSRRLIGLFAIGVAHAVILFPGDILTTYAVLGGVLLLLRGSSPRGAARIGVAVLALSAVSFLALALLLAAEPDVIDPGAIDLAARAAEAAYRGSPIDVVRQNLRTWPKTLAILLPFQAPSAFAMFLFGFAAGRWRLGERAVEHRKVLRMVGLVGLLCGLPAAAFYADAALWHVGTAREAAALAVDVVAAPLLAAAYAAGVLLLVAGPGGGLAIRWLAPAGRMALTNYLGQSLAFAVVFAGYGLGAVGRVGPLAVLALALVVYAVQLLLSRWWLARHAYGPVEWLLRSLTYAAWAPWRSRR